MLELSWDYKRLGLPGVLTKLLHGEVPVALDSGASLAIADTRGRTLAIGVAAVPVGGGSLHTHPR